MHFCPNPLRNGVSPLPSPLRNGDKRPEFMHPPATPLTPAASSSPRPHLRRQQHAKWVTSIYDLVLGAPFGAWASILLVELCARPKPRYYYLNERNTSRSIILYVTTPFRLRNGVCLRGAAYETLRNGVCPPSLCFLNARY